MRVIPRYLAPVGVFFLATYSSAATTFDHSLFDALLRRNVANGLVDYAGFGASSDFKRYLDSLDKAKPAELSESEQLAFWINTYNAYTIDLIVEHHEKDSIKNIQHKTAHFIKHGPFNESIVKAGGKTYDLDDVEHGIIRKKFKDPRAHFALVCAAVSCPSLRNEAYTGAKLDAQLNDQARIFLLRSPQKNHIDVAKGVFHASPIIVKYYPKDFGKDDTAIAQYLSRFYPSGPEKQFLTSFKGKFEPTDYDWTLNSKENARSK